MQATLDASPGLMEAYKQWQYTYLEYYRRIRVPLAEATGTDTSLRGKSAGSGAVAPPPIDWGSRLNDAEQGLLTRLRNWLRHSEELDELRREIARAGRTAATADTGVDLLITCNSIELARLPWETWDITSDFAIASKIRIARSALNTRQPAAVHSQRRRPRILMILGDNRGLNFKAEIEALQCLLHPLADLKDVGWRPKQCIDDLKDEISRTIADPKGWDVLLFAGHSNETDGGELGIAPGVAIHVSDIEQARYLAKKQLWSDFWQILLSVRQPSERLRAVLQATAEYVCGS